MRDSRDVDAREGGEGTNEDARDVHGGGARVGGGGGRGTCWCVSRPRVGARASRIGCMDACMDA